MHEDSRPQRPADPVEDVFGPFRDDHVRVLARLDSIERSVVTAESLTATAAVELEAIVALLRVQFGTHVAAEESALYPALLEAFPEAAASLGPLGVEHAEMRSMLAHLDALLGQPQQRRRDEQIVIQTRDLVDLLRIHIRKEEQAVFDVAARVLTAPEVARLAERVANHRDDLGPESGPSAGKGNRS